MISKGKSPAVVVVVVVLVVALIVVYRRRVVVVESLSSLHIPPSHAAHAAIVNPRNHRQIILMGNAAFTPTAGVAQRRLASALLRGGKTKCRTPTLAQVDAMVLHQATRLMHLATNTDSGTLVRRATSNTCIGDGLFAVKDIEAGELIAFFPGLFHLEVPSEGPNGERVKAAHASSWGTNDMMLAIPSSHGGGRVDGQAYELVQANPTTAGTSTEAAEMLRCMGGADVASMRGVLNRFAVGHLFNHPPAGKNGPHVMAWPIFFEEVASEERGEQKHMPSVCAQQWYTTDHGSRSYPSPLASRVPIVGMLTTRRIAANEEIMFDYNLRPESSLAKGGVEGDGWYVARNMDADAEREAREI